MEVSFIEEGEETLFFSSKDGWSTERQPGEVEENMDEFIWEDSEEDDDDNNNSNTNDDATEEEEDDSPRRGGNSTISDKQGRQHDRNRLGKKHRPRQTVNSAGEVVFKGHPSYGLMVSLQLAITIVVGHINTRPQRDISVDDFKLCNNIAFPSQGSSRTPPHHGRDFQFKDYAPMVFRHLRERFGISAEDYLSSLCDLENEMSRLGTPGRSGAMFFFSQDGQYAIKTITRREVQYLKQILPEYYNHVMRNPNTLLPRFYGLHRLKPGKGSNVRFVVMNNVFDTDKRIHQMYDLKGSTVKRFASSEEKLKPIPVWKDMDLNKHFLVGDKRRSAILEQLESDVAFLSKMKLMDYSLLVGIHYFNREKEKVNPNVTNEDLNIQQPPSKSLRRGRGGVPNAVESPTTIGCKRNIFQREEGGMMGFSDNYNDWRSELYYIGIIDILQRWNTKKKLERFGKRITENNKDEISAVPAPIYADRFINFMNKIFK
eukprot:gb/GECH01012578.1/.p1 GENE.gb/GECH01012578.1/~~gb/GECH01012578.1/.p1  ORF type:complete len:486 (+),score=102.55 gb/GECH01012578.1/:1-1458(+)